MGDEFFSAILGAGASHIGGKSAERFSRRYGLVLTAVGLAGLWYLHRRVNSPAPPAVGLQFS